MRILLLSVTCLWFSSSLQAGDFRGQARELDGTTVGNLTVTALRADGRVVFSNFFPAGNFTIPINNNALFADNQALTLIFSSPGRDDARLDNLLGSGNSTLDVILPLKMQAGPQQNQPCYRRWRCHHRCR